MFIFSQGLFKFDFTDHHAILGVSLDAEFDEIRKRYMLLARRLHPDTCPFEKDIDKELANELLSKFVSPAYNKFSKKKERAELFVILKELRNNITYNRSQIELKTDIAKQIAHGGNYKKTYKLAIQELSDRQYQYLDKTLEITGEISELNLAYLLRKQTQNQDYVMPQRPPTQPPKDNNKSTTIKPKAQNPLVDQACRRAETFISTKNYAQAILELKGTLKTDPNDSRYHALLGFCYLHQNQNTMAKIEIKKALSLNPKDPKALEVQKILEQPKSSNNDRKKTGKVASKTKQKVNKTEVASKTKQKVNKTEQAGGLFGALFGRNKK